MRLKDIDFDTEYCCFNKNYCFEFENEVYELLVCHPTHEFKVVFSEDDYDYVEDEQLIKRLRAFVKTNTKLS